MRPSIRALLVPILATLAVAPAALAADTPAPEAATLARPAEPPAAPEVAPRLPAHWLSPMVAEMFAALDEQRAKIGRVRAELAQARDGARAFELQRAISAAKQETEVRLLRIQADHARRDGRLEVAAKLDAALTAMTTPAPAREPEVRPAPRRDGAR